MAELILLWNRKPGPDHKRSDRCLPIPEHSSTHRLGRDGPAAVVVAAHEHLPASTADGAVGLVAVVIVLVSALQEWVLSEGRGEKESVKHWQTTNEWTWGPCDASEGLSLTLQPWHMAPTKRGCSRETLRLPQEMQISAQTQHPEPTFTFYQPFRKKQDGKRKILIIQN